MSQTILMMAGGTGGHIFPALAVARHLQALGYQLHWLGAKQGMESTLIDAKEFPLHLVPVTAMKGGGLLRKLWFPVNLLRALWSVFRLFGQIKPDVVVGFGGYASGPGGIMALMLGKHLVLHEQNAVAGFTNRILARFAHKVIEAFPNTFAPSYKLHTLGNPVRAELVALRATWQSPVAMERVLVLGGSLGAQTLNALVPEGIAAMLPEDRPEIWHQAGPGKNAAVADRYLKAGINARVDAFISHMDEAYAWADIVVCRSGASTVSELAIVGKPALFMPYPWHKDRQQFVNADYLVNAGAATLMPQDDTGAATLGETLSYLRRHPEALQTMAEHARSQGKPDAVALIGQVIIDLLPPHMGKAA